MSVIKVTNQNFEEEVMKSEKPVLLDFWASWCGPCRMLSPIVEEFEKKNQEVKVCKVNVDEESELASNFRVMSIPTLVVMKAGKVINSSVGLVNKEKIMELVEVK